MKSELTHPTSNLSVKNVFPIQHSAMAYLSRGVVVSPLDRHAASHSSVGGIFIQRTLEVGQSGDFYERQADAVADRIMRKPFDGEEISSCPVVSSISTLQCSGNSGSSFAVTSGMENRLNSSRGGGSALPSTFRSQMEGGFGFDFSAVRVHTDAPAVQMSREINAKAFLMVMIFISTVDSINRKTVRDNGYLLMN